MNGGRGSPAWPAAAGFTLLELLVAIAIFALMAALALGGLNNAAIQNALAEEEMQRLNRLQRAMRLLMDDVSQVHPRCVRDEMGTRPEPPLVADGRGEFDMRLTRGGWRNPAGLPRGTLQRVQYRLEDGELRREYWPVLDRVLGTEPRSEVVFDEVLEFRLEFLDGDEWRDIWPPPRLTDTGRCDEYPRAIRITLDLAGWGEIQRIAELTR